MSICWWEKFDGQIKIDTEQGKRELQEDVLCISKRTWPRVCADTRMPDKLVEVEVAENGWQEK